MKQELFLHILVMFSITVASQEGTVTTIGNVVLFYPTQIK